MRTGCFFAQRPSRGGPGSGQTTGSCTTGLAIKSFSRQAPQRAFRYQAESYDETDWPWRVNVSLPWVVEFIHDGAPLHNMNVTGRDLGVTIKRRSHIRLTEEEYEAAVRALGGTP